MTSDLLGEKIRVLQGAICQKSNYTRRDVLKVVNQLCD